VTFKEILPDQKLQPYIKGFYFYESDNDMSFDDIVFPSGNMEVIFNLGDGHWQVKKDDAFYTTPPVELWGQITKPLAIKSSGKNTMLGIRFYPYSAAYFFSENVGELNNEIHDAADLFGRSVKTLHIRLQETTDLNKRITLVQDYLLNRLTISDKNHNKIKLIGEIATHLKNENVTDVSIRNNISTRYLNQLFTQYTGLAPKLYCKINRFQNSLNLLQANTQKLTGVAYDAGYFDQSHFIREFKLFTGITPTSFATQTLPINQLLAIN
jgi:AraC-like DNA-binding protein